MLKKEIIIRNATCIYTSDPQRPITKGDILIIGNQIKKVGGKILATKYKNAQMVDANGKLVVPGLINTHHHLFQGLMRGIPQIQNQPIEQWIKIVMSIALQMEPQDTYYAALIGMSELALYGATTTVDMHYLSRNVEKDHLRAIIQAAKDVGMRLHLYKGSVSLSQKDGALFPDAISSDSETIARDSEDFIRRYHDKGKFSMLRVGLAPCNIFTNTAEDYKSARTLSDKYDVRLQTHLSESRAETLLAKRKFGKRPLDLMEEWGWEGKKVSFVHGIDLNSSEINRIAASHTNIVHCPISNARASVGENGIAPIYEMLNNRVNVGIGVDGSAGNDSSNMVEEMRWARTMQGARKNATYLKPEKVLQMATINGAALLGQQELGKISVGYGADMAIFDLEDIEHMGTHDPLTALVSNTTRRAETVIVNGKIIVKNGHLVGVDEEKVALEVKERMNRLGKFTA